MSIENEIYERGYVEGRNSAEKHLYETIERQKLIIDEWQRRYRYLLETLSQNVAYQLPAPIIVSTKDICLTKLG